MSKLSLETLKERSELVASDELLNSISGGTENCCHEASPQSSAPPPNIIKAIKDAF